ncbi:MAG TPA: DUF3471 domain-containing protein [Gammaproteobacteria bacterium]|nr:DUF3471 domain-containing protein [Gammaproteobacteria bacterium]
MKSTLHPALFLGGALLFCGLVLWLRPALPPSVATASHDFAKPVHEPPKTVTLDAATLERYVGEYEGRANFAVKLTQEHNHLFAHVKGSPVLELLAKSETEFFVKGNPQIDVKFRVDRDGLVEGFAAETGAGPLSAHRVR